MNRDQPSTSKRTASPEAQFDLAAAARAYSPQGPVSIQEAVEQLAAREARRFFALSINELELRQIFAQIQNQQRSLRTRIAINPALAPLYPPPAPHMLAPTQPILDTLAPALPHTVEELTAAQLRKVFNFMATASARATPQLPADPALLTTTQQQQAVMVVYHLRQLEDTFQHATLTFVNIQTSLLRSDPVQVKYVKFMAFIHVLQHISTTIITHRDLICDALLPNFFARSQPFLEALSSQGINETHVMDTFMAASAMLAHATRLIRILEHYQLDYVMTRHTEEFSAVDEEYKRLSMPSQPEPLLLESRTYVHVLRWWQEHYEDILHSTLTDEYISLCRRDEPAEQGDQPVVEQVRSDAQQGPSTSEQSVAHEEQQQPEAQQQQVVTVVMNAQKISALPIEVQPELQQSPHSPSTASVEILEETRDIPLSRESTSQSSGERMEQGSAPATPPPRPPFVVWEGGPVSTRRREAPDAHDMPLTGMRRRQPPCVFCRGETHFSAECNVVRRMTNRVQIALDRGFCTTCLWIHYGRCRRDYVCNNCSMPRHHRAFCRRNTAIVQDMPGMSPEEFYAWLDNISHPPMPSGEFPQRAGPSQPPRHARN